MISVIGGTLRNRKLRVPKGTHVRPTTNRVRESVFNVLNHHLLFEEMAVLDLYAGTGALGIEAISRGAFHAYFIENNPIVFAVLKQNITLVDPEIQGTIRLIYQSTEKWLPHFTHSANPCLIFVDPPYQQGSYQTILSFVDRLETIPIGSVVVVESPVKMSYSIPDSMKTFQEKHYGQIKINFLKKCKKS